MNADAFTTATTWRSRSACGGGPVEVEVVDDRDVTGTQPAHERRRSGGRPGRCRSPRAARRRRSGARGISWPSNRDTHRVPIRGRAGACVSHLSGGPPGLLRGREQLLGVRQRRVGVLQPGEHPGQLADPAAVVERGQPRGGDGAVVGSSPRRRGGRRTRRPAAGG